jgi:integrase
MSGKKYPGVIVRQTGKGTSFGIRYFDASAKRVFVQLGYAPEWTAKRASDERRRRTVAAEKGHVEPSRSKITFGEHSRDWLSRWSESRGLQKTTASSYKTIVAHLDKAIGHIILSKLTFQDIEKYMQKARRDGASPRTCNSHLQVAGAVLKDAVKRGLIPSNPALHVERMKEQRREWRILTPVEFRAVSQAFTTLDHEQAHVCRVAFLIMAELGLRRGEALGLKWSRVRLADPSGPTVRVEETFTANETSTPKSSTSYRTLTLSNELAGALMDLRAASDFGGDADYVLASPTGRRPLDVHTYYAVFRDACKAAGVEDAESIRPCHDLRHTSLTNGALSGMSPASLQARAGHSSYSVTQRYVALAGRTFADEDARLTDRLYGTHENAKAPVP